MFRAGPPPPARARVAEMVPIENETSERVVRTVVFLVPPAMLAVAGWMAWGGTLHWHDLVVLAITYTADRVRRHGRLSPAVHPPQLQDHAAPCARCWPCSARWRSRAP